MDILLIIIISVGRTSFENVYCTLFMHNIIGYIERYEILKWGCIYQISNVYLCVKFGQRKLNFQCWTAVPDVSRKGINSIGELRTFALRFPARRLPRTRGSGSREWGPGSRMWGPGSRSSPCPSDSTCSLLCSQQCSFSGRSKIQKKKKKKWNENIISTPYFWFTIY